MSAEQNLWKWLKRETQHLVKTNDLHLCRIENGVPPYGYPDVEGCYASYNFHLELKAVKRPKRKTTKIKVRFEPGQIPWLRRRWIVGGSCWVLLQVGSGRDAARYLISGCEANQLQTGLTEQEIQGLSITDPVLTGSEIFRHVVRFP